jgi:hypothetical protein
MMRIRAGRKALQAAEEISIKLILTNPVKNEKTAKLFTVAVL